MMLTEEMIAKDEKRWHARNIVAELGHCGKNIRHRKNITNDDIRFYAYIMRKARAMLKERESVIESLKSDLSETLAVLGEQPEIVRCRDCERHRECDYWIENGDDWFCADGERRD